MKRGFTLIELLVVITILAVLAGAAMPYVQSYVEEARLAKAKTDLEEIARALMVYETREGEYAFSDVSVLTGRYLNKAPIDPWGKAYAVSTEGGYVYSGGPDRDLGNTPTTTEKGNDNIIFSYQPPLALVQVKWVDKNNSGAVDSQNVPDELHLTFSRRLSSPTAISIASTEVAGPFLSSSFTITSTSDIANIIRHGDNDVQIVASKTIILKVAQSMKDVFSVGSDTISVKSGHETIYDLARPNSNACISEQPATILPQ